MYFQSWFVQQQMLPSHKKACLSHTLVINVIKLPILHEQPLSPNPLVSPLQGFLEDHYKLYLYLFLFLSSILNKDNLFIASIKNWNKY